MDLAITAMRQVLVLFLLMFAGFAGVKAGLIRMEGKKAFSDLLVNLICPCMILNSYFAEYSRRCQEVRHRFLMSDLSFFRYT